MSLTLSQHNLKIIVQIFGVGLLILGVFALFAAPLEVFTYYSFSAGGKFHFDGFEFGSLMFAIITIQVIGYYFIALLGLFLGYSHLTFQAWTRKIMLTLLWDWMVLGGPLSLVAFLLLISSKDLPPTSLPFVGLIMICIYPVFPLLLIKFYSLDKIKTIFSQNASRILSLEQTPVLILVSVGLMIFFIFALHLPLLFYAVFPWFGKFISGVHGVYIIDYSIIILIILTWGVLSKKEWAWAGSILYLLFMIITSVTTFLNTSTQNLFALLKFAPMEQEIVKNVPIQGYHFLLFFSLPLLALLIILIFCRPLFTRKPSQ